MAFFPIALMYTSAMKLTSHTLFILRNLALTLFLTLACNIEAGAADGAAKDRILAAAVPEIFGYIEEVMLEPGRQWTLKAKLDTGADTSSLDARDMRRVKAGGKSYVRFTVIDPHTKNEVSLRRPYVRSAKIRRHDGKHQRRRVVLMTVCLGRQERTIEVTLSDRSEFDYSMLLGRNALAGLAVVDPRLKLTQEPGCWTSDSHVRSSTLAKQNLKALGNDKIIAKKTELSPHDQDDTNEHIANKSLDAKAGSALATEQNEPPGTDAVTTQKAPTVVQ